MEEKKLVSKLMSLCCRQKWSLSCNYFITVLLDQKICEIHSFDINCPTKVKYFKLHTYNIDRQLDTSIYWRLVDIYTLMNYLTSKFELTMYEQMMCFEYVWWNCLHKPDILLMLNKMMSPRVTAGKCNNFHTKCLETLKLANIDFHL